MLSIIKIPFAIFLGMSVFLPYSLALGSERIMEFQQFSDIYEPSGVVQLADRSLLIIEDEKHHPFSLLKLSKGNRLDRLPLSISTKNKKIKLDDLEGIAYGDDDWIYAITSHSRTSKGKSKKKRERLVRFHVKNGQLLDYQKLPSLTTALIQAFNKPIKRPDKLNIEGLAYNKKNKSLLLGVRRPLPMGQAAIIQINHIDELFNTKNIENLSTTIIALDLQGKGIRSLSYDPVLQGYLIIAGSVKKRDGPFELWLWKDNTLKRIQLSGIENIGYAEGITPIKTSNGDRFLLFVMDDGERGEAAAHYVILSYEQLHQ